MIKIVKTKDKFPSKLTSISEMYQKVSHHIIRRIPILPSFEKYNITICHEKKFIWFRVAKVGTRTIFNILRTSEAYLDVEHAYSCYYPKFMFKGYFKFAFIRNPYDRLVSCWINKVVNSNHFGFTTGVLLKMQKFENFVDFVSSQNIEECDIHIRLQSKLIDLNGVDYIGRFELFENDLRYILKTINIDFPLIPNKNSSSDRLHYREYYDDNLKTKVAKIYKKDLNVLSYDF